MATLVVSRLGLSASRGVVSGASGAPRHRGCRARGVSSRPGASGDVGDNQTVRLGRKTLPGNARSGVCPDSADRVVSIRDSSTAAPRAYAESLIRVVVDSVELDDSPFEAPRNTDDCCSAEENFRSAGGEARQTVRVLTTVLRTVSDGKDRLLPIVASALISNESTAREHDPVDESTPDVAIDETYHDDDEYLSENENENENEYQPGRFVKLDRVPYFFHPPDRVPHPTSRVQSFHDASANSPSYGGPAVPYTEWPPPPRQTRGDPLLMCREYMYNCLRPKRLEHGTWRGTRTVTFPGRDGNATQGAAPAHSYGTQHDSRHTDRETTSYNSSTLPTFNGYGSDSSGSGMHQDVSFDSSSDDHDDAGTDDETRLLDVLDAQLALEQLVTNTEGRLYDARSENPTPRASAPPPLSRLEIEPEEVDDLLNTLEDSVTSEYLVIACDESSAHRGLTATLWATPKDVSHDSSCDACDDDDDESNVDNSLSVRPVVFDVRDWVRGYGRQTSKGRKDSSLSEGHHLRGVRKDSGLPLGTSETRVRGLDSVLALCVSLKRGVPIFVTKDVANKSGVAPNARRSSFRSVGRMGSLDDWRQVAMVGTRHEAGGAAHATSATNTPSTSATRGTSSDAVLSSDAIHNLGEETDPDHVSDPDALDAFDVFLRSALGKLKRNKKETLFKDDPYVLPPQVQRLVDRRDRKRFSDTHTDFFQSRTRGPVSFFKEVKRLWVDWYNRAKWFHDQIVEFRAIAKTPRDAFRVRFSWNIDYGVTQTDNANDSLARLTGKRGDLYMNAVAKSVGTPGKVTALDRHKLDYMVAQRVATAAALRRRAMLTELRDAKHTEAVAPGVFGVKHSKAFGPGVFSPGTTQGDETVSRQLETLRTGAHVLVESLFETEWRDVDPEARVLVTKWKMALIETVDDEDLIDAELFEIDRRLRSIRKDVDFETAESGALREAFDETKKEEVTPGVASEELELAILQDRWEDAQKWLGVLTVMNGRCADHEAVFGKERE